jgi:hypothetical protein
MKIRFALLLLIGVLLFSGCEMPGAPVESSLYNIGISGGNRIEIGSEKSLYINNSPDFPWDDFICQTWQSSDPAIAIIDPMTGTITAAGAVGKATITLAREMKNETLTASVAVEAYDPQTPIVLKKLGLLSQTGKYYNIPLENLKLGEHAITVPPGLYTIVVSTTPEDVYFEDAAYIYKLYKNNFTYTYMLNSTNYSGYALNFTVFCQAEQ